MNDWIIYSALMFASSVITYLAVRKLQAENFNNQLITYALGATPFIFAFLITVALGKFTFLPWDITFIIAVTSIFMSYLGNKVSLLGVKYAPNPGYSLIIQKSYAPYTTIASALIFSSVVTLEAIIGIIVVIISAGQIMLGEKINKVTDKKWIIYSFAAFFLFGNLALVGKYVLNRGVEPLVFTTYIFFFAFLAFTVDMRKTLFSSQIIKSITKSQLAFLLIIGLGNALFNVFIWFATQLAPNIGYVNIINSSSITAIAIFSAIFFKDKLTTQKILGIIGVTCGLALILLF